jgi:hypothetical protein
VRREKRKIHEPRMPHAIAIRSRRWLAGSSWFVAWAYGLGRIPTASRFSRPAVVSHRAAPAGGGEPVGVALRAQKGAFFWQSGGAATRHVPGVTHRNTASPLFLFPVGGLG